jgi:hypothetical protein
LTRIFIVAGAWGSPAAFLPWPCDRTQDINAKETRMKAKLTALSCMLAAAGLASPLAMAQEKVKIGFVTDMSSPSNC